MKKLASILLIIALCIGVVGLTACGDPCKEGHDYVDGVCSRCQAKDPNYVAEVAYYIGSSLNGYAMPDEAYKMTPVEGKENLYVFTLHCTAENRDATYDGHWYKVTDGTWNNTWGTDVYELQPAPVKYDSAGAAIGLGSIWIDKDGDYIVLFDAATKKIYDSSMQYSIAPRIYGTISAITGGTDWGTGDADTIVMNDSNGDGLFTRVITVTAANSEGYDIAVAVSMLYYIGENAAWYTWGVGEQYLLDGTPGGMGATSKLIVEEGDYLFTYDASTHVTTYAKTVAGDSVDLATPVLYGDFNGWAIEGENACPMTFADGKWTCEMTMPAGDSSVFACLTKANYGEWGWGAGEQYCLDGSPSGMGSTSVANIPEAGVYVFTYDPVTHITTFAAK